MPAWLVLERRRTKSGVQERDSYALTQSNYLLANLKGIVLGCIEAKFSQPKTRWKEGSLGIRSWKALDEIYQIYVPLLLWSPA